jgi:multisubunit Na+/H+ antiporter MnhB subunit
MDMSRENSQGFDQLVHASRLLGTVPRTVSLVCAALLTVVLALVVLELLGQPPAGLTEPALEQLAVSGADNPVTAVLLNYRAYDTWLELGVLLLAIMASLVMLRSGDLRRFGSVPQDADVLPQLVGLYVPLIAVAGGYVLWQGTHAPGGAFQAGALWAAAGVLTRLAGVDRLYRAPGWMLRVGYLAAFGAFTLAGVLMLLRDGWFLEFPEEWAKTVIFGLELTAALSIAITLWSLYTTIYPAGEAPGQPAAP